MRSKRILAEDLGYYHCLSRTVNGAALLRRREKEVLRKMIHQVADFSGVEVLTFCLMHNHFHLLIRVAPAESIPDEELIRRYALLYPKPTKYQLLSMQAMARELRSNGPDADSIRTKLLARMGNVSAFMKTLKQRFSTWFNKTHDRFGPLWSDRFKSVLVEGRGHVLQTMAAYIDLNPVRAGLVDDPKNYRFCGYAEAVAGRKIAIQGIKFVMAGLYDVPEDEALADYRCLIFGKGSAPTAGSKQLDREKALQVLESEGGRLPTATLLRCRIRYFTEGAVLGSESFVMAQMAGWQRSMRRKHSPKPHLIPREDGAPFVVMRGLRGRAYS
jgi:REP element-mobilizing transposase RayT